MFKKILIALLVAFVIIQFFRVEKNQGQSPTAAHLQNSYPIPDSVQQLLKVACNDCHSNNTRYPWYNNIQPVAWWLADHVKEGKQKFNFDDFGNWAPKKQAHKMGELAEMIEKGEMPLKSYTITHTDAKLTAEQKALLINWAKGVQQSIQTKNGLPKEEEKE